MQFSEFVKSEQIMEKKKKSGYVYIIYIYIKLSIPVRGWAGMQKKTN